MCRYSAHVASKKLSRIYSYIKSNFGTACLRDTQICDEMFLADRKNTQ